MAYQFIKTEVADGVLTLTMHDPPTRNALSADMAGEMFERLDEFERNPEERVLVLTGTVPSFCSGANVRGFRQRIEERESRPEGENEPLTWGKMEYMKGRPRQKDSGPRVNFVPLRIHELQKPSIAVVNGPAAGVGCGLALSCDIRVVGESGRLSERFVLNGLIPGDGSCWQLPKLIGVSNTLLLQYTGDWMGGEDAVRIGLASRCFPDDRLMAGAMELATRIAHGPTVAHSLTKYLVQQSMDLSLREALELASAAQEHVRKTEDHKIAVQWFLDKNRGMPPFVGR